jgi:glutamate--cysteine ligase
MEIMVAMEGIGEILDGDDPERPYSRSLALQKAVINDPEQTPSARVLAEMRTNKESFFEFAKRLSQSHRSFFMELPPNPERSRFFEEKARQSWQRQRELESENKLSFDEFLRHYFAQT